jgi:hypothetical protein
MCPKIDMMEREYKKLEFGGELNRALASQLISRTTLTETRPAQISKEI